MEFERAYVSLVDLLGEELFRAASLTPGPELTALAQSEIPEVREAVVNRLDDQGMLAKFAVQDKAVAVRSAAVEKLTDQTLLAKIATDDKDETIRFDAEDRRQKLQRGQP